MLVTQQVGINGAFSVSPKLGAIVLMWVLPGAANETAPSVTVRIVGAEPLLGASFLLSGGALVLSGVLIRKKKASEVTGEGGLSSAGSSEPPEWARNPPLGPPPEW